MDIDILKKDEVKVGKHLIININNNLYDDIQLINILDNLIKHVNLTVLNKMFHNFKPHGLTGIYLLSESHISIHTWPEHNKICIDIFTCGKINEINIINYLELNFNEMTIISINR